jgi:two-component system, LuxR family, response regulator FixJ
MPATRLRALWTDRTAEGQAMPERRGLMVHVIDDDEAVRESLEALLVVAGFEVTTHASAEAYLDGARSGECVLVDVNMPGMGGLELLQKLAQREPQVPVLVLTASREPRLRERALELGARAFLTKPVPESDLLRALRAAQNTGDRPT